MVESRFPVISDWPAEFSSAVGLLSLGMLISFRKSCSRGLLNSVYVVNILAILIALLSTNSFYARGFAQWVPFQAASLACFLAGLVAPSFLMGAISILMIAGSSIVQFNMFSAELKSAALLEPWGTVAFAIIGIFALIYRFKQAELDKEVRRSRIRAELTKQLAHSMLGVRDLMNTPLQNLEFSASLLKDKKNDVKEIAECISRAVQGLKTLNKTLNEFEAKIDWTERDLSFDALEKIRGNLSRNDNKLDSDNLPL
jgi:hypothetical protein